MKVLLIFSMLFVFLITPASYATTEWQINDVSFLMPLPGKLDEDRLLTIQTQGKGGPLLNPAFLGTIPPLTPVMTEADVAASLRVIAVRIDPCFPLQVHPAWSDQGDQSPALTEFNQIVRKYAGLGSLSRVTVMVVRGAGDMWSFSGFEVQQGQLKVMKIPRVDRGAQAFINFAVPSDHFERGMISPVPQGVDTFNKVIGNSARMKVGNEELLRQELRAIHRAENPHLFNPENMDCASCHVAQPARVWLERNRSDLGLETLWNQHAYKNPRHNLKNISPDLKNTHIIRAFGYFGENIAISQRVIHESAETADAINRYLKAF